MNILVIILIAIGGLVALYLLIAFFTKREVSVEKNIQINRPNREVFDYIKMLKNQENYSVWVMKDPNINLVYTGVDGTVGAASSWKSKDSGVGVGEQEIIELQDGHKMKVEIRFKKPFEGTSYATTTLSGNHSETTVSNVFESKSKFPMNFMNLFMDKLIGKDMQKNLSNMKANLEKQS